MLKHRVIPVILWDGRSYVVQTVGFERPARIFGSLMDAVRVYDRRNVDELILIDIDATKKRRDPNFAAIKQFTSEVFCPVTVGGGVRTLDGIKKLLRCGADKVALKYYGIPSFIERAAKKFGSQAIVRAMDHHDWMTYDSMLSTLRRVEAAGAGEILLTSVARNGTMTGYDIDLIRRVSEVMSIPVVAHGGCGCAEHMLGAIRAGAAAAAASTMFLFTETTPRECSMYLAGQGIPARVR